jgi:hypothetical protein
LSTPEEREVAALLVRKAASDLAAARALAADADQLDDVVGFHVQQAVEKAIKSALELAMERGIEAPLSLDDAERLTPWAVATRYDEVFAGLDRAAAMELAVAAVDWARAVTAPTG